MKRQHPESPLFLSPLQARRVQDIVRGLRKLLGTQDAVARQLGISQQRVAAALAGRVTLGFAALLSMHKRMLLSELIGPREEARAA